MNSKLEMKGKRCNFSVLIMNSKLEMKGKHCNFSVFIMNSKLEMKGNPCALPEIYIYQYILAHTYYFHQI